MLKEVKIEITNLCYRNCKHCSSDATCEADKYHFMNKNKIKDIIKQASEMGAESIVFTGGEATLHPSLDKFVKYAHQLGMKTKLYTLCYRTDENILLLKKLNKDGLNEIIYSTATSLIMSKELSTYTIDDFVKRLANESTLQIGFHHVVTSETIDCIKDLNKYIDSAGNHFSKLSFLRYVPHGRGGQDLVPNNEQYSVFNHYLFDLMDKYGDGIRIGSPFNILNINNTPCTAAEETIIVGFDGHVYPCDAMKYFDDLGSGGNINKSSLKEIYDSLYFKNIRLYKDFHGEKCQSCKNYKLCKGGCLGQKMIYATSIKGALTFDDYDLMSKRTQNDFKTRERLLLNASLGNRGEMGIIFNELKKLLTHDCDDATKEKLYKSLILKIGDHIWYHAASLSSYHQIPFAEMGQRALNKTSSIIKIIDSNLIKYCACLSDPECPYKNISKSSKVSDLDDSIANNKISFDINKHWKYLDDVSYKLRDEMNREKIIELTAELLVLLGQLCHYYLNTTLEQVMTYNILQLQHQYAEGYDKSIASTKAYDTATTRIKRANVVF